MIGLAKLMGFAPAARGTEPVGEPGADAPPAETETAFHAILARFGLAADPSAGTPSPDDAPDAPPPQTDDAPKSAEPPSGHAPQTHRLHAVFAARGAAIEIETPDAGDTADVAAADTVAEGEVAPEPEEARARRVTHDPPPMPKSAKGDPPPPSSPPTATVTATAPPPPSSLSFFSGAPAQPREPVADRPAKAGDATPKVRLRGEIPAAAPSPAEPKAAAPTTPLPLPGAPAGDPAEPVAVSANAAKSDPATLVVEATVVGRETHLQPLAPRTAGRRTAPAAAPSPPAVPPRNPPAPPVHSVAPATTPEAPVETVNVPGDAPEVETPPAPAATRRHDASASRQSVEPKAPAPAPKPPGEPPSASATSTVSVASVAGAAAPATGDNLSARAVQTIASAVAAAAAAPGMALQTSAAAARVLTVRLDLPDHGGVDVRIRMADNALDIRIVADREDTARRIRHERDSLTEALRKGGHDATVTSVDARRVEGADGARQQQSATASHNGNGAGTGPGANADGGGGDGRSAPQSRGGPFMDDHPADSRTEGTNAGTPADLPADRLYV